MSASLVGGGQYSERREVGYGGQGQETKGNTQTAKQVKQ
jgi:hypothetical protein